MGPQFVIIKEIHKFSVVLSIKYFVALYGYVVVKL